LEPLANPPGQSKEQYNGYNNTSFFWIKDSKNPLTHFKNFKLENVFAGFIFAKSQNGKYFGIYFREFA